MTAALAATRHFTYASAADEFEIPERWLRTHIKSLPHRRFGRYVRFSTADMIAISERFAVQENDPTGTHEPLPASAVPDIRPSSQHRSRKKTSPNLREQAGLETTNSPSRA